MEIDSAAYRIAPGAALRLDEVPTMRAAASGSKRLWQQTLERHVARLAALQTLLFAQRRQALLLVLQGMDTAGKDGVIRRLACGLNPQGMRVVAFGRPSAEELARSWLHRHWLALPERGRIAIFNRSHYEEVVTVRATPHLLAARGLAPRAFDDPFWAARLRDIAAFERHLAENGTAVAKIFLHISRQEQRRRLLERLDNPLKAWKFEPADLAARQRWQTYQRAYEAAISATSTADAPWHVVPADDKMAARAIVAGIVAATLERMAPQPPAADARRLRELAAAREALESDVAP